MPDFVGKRIQGIEDRGYDGLRIHLEDGTCLDVTGTGYETDGATYEYVTHAMRRRQAFEDMGARERGRLGRLCRQELEVRVAREWDAYQAQGTNEDFPTDYMSWLRVHHPGLYSAEVFGRTMRAVWSDSSLARQIYASSPFREAA